METAVSRRPGWSLAVCLGAGLLIAQTGCQLAASGRDFDVPGSGEKESGQAIDAARALQRIFPIVLAIPNIPASYRNHRMFHRRAGALASDLEGRSHSGSSAGGKSNSGVSGTVSAATAGST